MNPSQLDLSWSAALNPSSAEVTQAMLLSLTLGLLTALLYRFALPGRLISPDLQRALIMLSMVGCLVMMLIGNNIARAFSLVGALAIVRFRTRLQSPLDITFVFLALAHGIGCGVFAWKISMIGTLTVYLALIGIAVLPLAGFRGELRTLRCDLAAYEGNEQALREVLERHTARCWLKQAQLLRFGETLSYRYSIVVLGEEQIDELLRALSRIEALEKVILDGDDSQD